MIGKAQATCATQKGDGGKVVLWSDVANAESVTRVSGHIAAKAGVGGGDGGKVETSGYALKTSGINLDLTAEKGSGGLWLLDPTNITISGSATTAGATPLPNYESNVDSSTVLNSDIETQLNSGTSVTIQTGSGGSQAGDITLASDIVTGNMAGEATLTLKAHRNIVVNSGVSIDATQNSNTNELNITLHSDAEGGSVASGASITAGAIQVNNGASIKSNGGDIVLGGGADIASGYAFATGSLGTGAGIQLTNAVVDSAGGDITMRGRGNHAEGASTGVVLDTGTSISSGLGKIDITGMSDAFYTTASTTVLRNGIRMYDATIASTSTASDAITLSGQEGYTGGGVTASGGSGSNREGISLTNTNISAAGGVTFAADKQIYNNSTLTTSGTSDSLSITSYENDAFWDDFTWSGSLSGSDFVGSNSIAGLTINGFSNLNGLTIGKATSTTNSKVVLSSDISIEGPVSVYANDIDMNKNITITGAGENILMKASGYIFLLPGFNLTTNGGDVTLWSNLANVTTTAGENNEISLYGNNDITTNGGKIVLAGGADTNSDGIPDGYAFRGIDTNNFSGVHLTGSTNLDSSVAGGGGDIIIRGSSYGEGVKSSGALKIDSGTGTITIDGKSTQDHGVEFNGDAIAITTENTTSDAIKITGSTAGPGKYGVVLGSGGTASRNTLIQATGANGGITISGTSVDSIGLYGTERGLLQVLAQSGEIILTGQNQSGSTGETDADFRNGAADNNILFYLGNRKDATVVNGVTSLVTSSSSNINLQGDFFSWGTNEPVINTTGAFTLESVSDSFSTLQNARTSWFTFTNIGGLTIGKSTNIQNVTVNEALNAGGDVNLYGKDIIIDNTINTSGALLTKASRHNSVDADITAASAKFWADSDKDGDGINLITASNITTNGGSLEFGNADTHASGFLVGGDVYVNSPSAQTLTTNGGDLTVHGETLLANVDGLTINTTGGNIAFDGSINSANLYTSVSDGDISWDQARINARSGTYGSAIGDSYLVTIGSRLENAVAGKIADYDAAWIGAARNGSGAWYWVDGPESGQVFFQQTAGLGLGGTAVNGLYNNFNPNEPNNFGGNEWVGQFVGTEGKWNDLPGSNPNGVLKYVKETNLASSNIAINSGAGSIIFTGDIGASKALGTLDITSSSDVTFPGAITTQNTQTYNAAVKLANDTVLTTTNSDIIFNSTVDSLNVLDPKNLTTNILADTAYYWVDWTSATATQVLGTITIGGKVINVTFDKSAGFLGAQTNGGTNYWTGRLGNAFNGASPYLSSAVANGPTGSDIIQLSTGGSQTLTFSESIENLAFSVVSMNGGDFEFNQDFDIESYTGLNGASAGYWGGGTMVKTTTGSGTFKVTDGGTNASSDGGSEPHGTLRFANSFSELTWQDVTEAWHGFTVGVSGATADAGKVQFNNNVGSSAALGDIDINGAMQTSANISAANAIDVSGFSSIGGDIATIGNQNYQSAIELTADTVLSSSDVSGNGDITTNATIEGAFNLSINTQAASNTVLAGAIGASTQLKNVSMTTDELTLNGINVEDSSAISISNIGESTLSDVISGTDVTFTKGGTGTLILTSNNTYTGDTTISNGTLAITTVTGLGTTAGITAVADGATLDVRGVSGVAENLTVDGGTVSTSTGTSSFSGDIALTEDSLFSVAGTALTVSGDVAGGFGIEKAASGTLTLAGNNTYTESTTITAGTLNVTGTLADTSDVTVASGATYDVDKTDTIQSLSGAGTINIAGTKTLTTGDSGDDTISGIIEGAGSFTKAGSGTLTLSGDNTYTGVTAINAGELLIENDTPSFASSSISGAGNLVIQSQANSFSAAFTPSTAGFNLGPTLGGLTLGKSTNTANITLGSATSIAGNIDIYGGDITINEKLEATNSGVIKLSATGNISDSASGYVIADNLALLDGAITLDNALNTVTNLAASGTDAISFINSGALNLSSIGATNGLTSTGAIDVATKTGDLTVSQNITGDSIILNAGKDTAAGTATGGNIIISSSPTFTASSGNTVLYSGDISDSIGLTTLVGSGSGNFRYNSDETATNFTNALGATGVFAVYREQPSATGTISSETITYGAANPSFSLVGGGGLINGDSSSGLSIVDALYSTAGKLNANSYTVTASGLAALGYSVSGVTNGDLTVNKKDLNVTGLTTNDRDYNATKVATLGGAASVSALASDVVSLDGTTTGEFADKNVGIDKVVTITGNTISGADAANYSLLQQAGLTADITQADLFVSGLSVSDKVYDATDIAGLNGTATITALGSDTVNLGGTATGAFADKDVDTDKTVTVTGNTISGTDAGNYNLVQQAGLEADITQADLFISGLSASDKVYDATDIAGLTGTATITALGSDTLTLVGTVVGGFADKNVGVSKAVTVAGITVNGADAANYNLVQPSLTADITKANLNVIANDSAKFLVENDPGFTVSYAGFVPGETITELNGTLAIARVGSDTTAGTFGGVIQASGYSADNYAITYQHGDFTIVGSDQLLVNVTNVADEYSNETQYSVASAQYENNGTIYTLGSGGIAGSSVIIDADNLVTIDDGSSGSARFNLDPKSAVLSTANKLAVGAYQLGISGNVTENSGNFNDAIVVIGAHQVNAKGLTVNATGGVSKVYDGTVGLNDLSVGLTGLVLNDVVTVTGVGDLASKNVGSGLNYTVSNISLSNVDANNYYLLGGSSITGNNAEVRAKEINVAYGAVDKIYDGSSFSTVLESTNDILAGDTVIFTETAAFVDKNVANDKAVNISNIAISGGDAGNYTLSNTTAVATADITRLASVTWIGGATGNWFDPANWAGGAVPDLSNVANVVIPINVTVNFDTSGAQAPANATAAVNVDSIGAQGSLAQNSGTLNVGSGGLTLDSYSQSGGTLSVSGDVSLNDFAQSGGDISVVQDFTVSENFEQGSNGALTVGGNAAITDISGGLVVGNIDVAGTTSMTSTNGDITQATGTSILLGGATTLIASDGNGGDFDITLDGANNDFQDAVTATGKDITLADINALNVVLNASGNSVLTAGGNLNVGGNTNNLTTTTINGGETIFGTSTINGALTTTSDGDVTQTDAITVAGVTNIDAGVNDIALNEANNDFQNAVTVTGNNISLVDINALEVALNASGDSTLTAGGNLTVSGLTNNLTTETTNGGSTTFGKTSVNGNLDSTSNGDVTQTGALSVAGTASILAGVNTITLNNPNNNFQNAVITQAGKVFLAGSDYVDEVNAIVGSSVSQAKVLANSFSRITFPSIGRFGLGGNVMQNASIQIIPVEKEMALSEDNSFVDFNDDAYDSSQVNIFMIDGGVRVPAQLLNTLSKQP